MPEFISLLAYKEGLSAGRPQSDACLVKYFTAEEVKAAEGTDPVLQFTISTGAVDRDGDTINPAGWQLENYLKNPVVLFGHDYRSVPVGTALAVWVENDRLKSRARFTPREVNPFGYMVYDLCRLGFMRACSVGFKPITHLVAEDRPYGINFLSQELLEWSVVPIPANPDALVNAQAKGVDVLPLRGWAEQVLDEWQEKDGLYLSRKAVEDIYSSVEPPPTKSTNPTEPTAEAVVADEEDTGQDSEEVEERANKSGRVLSVANEARLKQAVGLLQEVLSQLDSDDDKAGGGPESEDAEFDGVKEGDQENGESRLEVFELMEEIDVTDFDEDTVREVIAAAVKERILAATGRLT